MIYDADDREPFVTVPVPPDEYEVVPLDAFADTDEEGADPVLGTRDGMLIPEDSDVMVYGDGGVGKTTLMVDLGFHLAAGDDWLGFPVPRPMRVLFIENEGPRPLFRLKLRRKRDVWEGSDVGDRVHVLSSPWGAFTFETPWWRELLASTIRELEIDVVICGPLTNSGMTTAGTAQEVRQFLAYVADVRQLAGQRFVSLLIHHENKSGQVSGAWEGAGDTLLHMHGQGHGKSRLYVQKARWDSASHAKAMTLLWAPGETFTVEEKPEIEDEELADRILSEIDANPGRAWSPLEETITGVSNDRLRESRDRLFADRVIANIVKRDGAEIALFECEPKKKSSLRRADDPSISHLRRESGADAAQTAPPLGAGGEFATAPCAPPYKGRTGGAVTDSAPGELFEADP